MPVGLFQFTTAQTDAFQSLLSAASDFVQTASMGLLNLKVDDGKLFKPVIY
jgi:hypothetical protein